MSESRLEVHVEGHVGAIPARTFLEVLRTSLDMLDQLERAGNPGKARRGKWLIAELRNNSAVAVLRRDDPVTPAAPVRLVNGIRQLQVSQDLPQYFSPGIAECLAKIGSQVRQEGVTGISFRVPNPSEPSLEGQVSEPVVENARASIEEVERAIGSVSGVLDVINLRRGAHKVSLYDGDSRRAVRCQFPDPLFDTVREALGKAVRALGEVTRNRRGQVLSLAIMSIEVHSTDRNAPTVDELAGIAPWYAGKMSTDEYVRWTRHG